MRKIIKAFLLTLILSLMASPASAMYEFDDLLGPSGKGTQWVVINDTNETIGAPYDEAIKISADLLTSSTATLKVLSGNTTTPVYNPNLQTLFLVLTEGEGQFSMTMNSQQLDFDVSTPNLGMDTIVNENMTAYVDNKTADQSNNTTSDWKTYHFSVARQQDRNRYDTVIQSFMFQQNPDNKPSQAITRPMVISNVFSGTATTAQAPLTVRMSLRDTPGSDGNIIAYDRTTWQMTDSLSAGGNQWVFIPVNDLNTDNARIERYLTTEITNNTAYRYAARYYDSTGGTVPPDEWKFDIFRPQGTTNIPRVLLLDDGSNIAPGLTTVYNRRYNINEQNKIPLHVFPVDTPDYGDYDLRLNHRIIFGKNLGSYSYPAQEGRFNLFEVTAFQPRLSSTTFYEDVARVTGSEGTVTPLSSTTFTAASIKRNVIADEVLQYFTVDHSIPYNVSTSGTEGILPLHITFNIPVTMISDTTWWNEMLNIWRNTGNIADMFANKYDLYLMADDNNVWNLTQELRNKGNYNDAVKVFYDESRGRVTQDNYSGLLTVSFMVMLMDGTRDGVRPELSIIPDRTPTQQQATNYIVIRDGALDNRWNMTFFVAPAGWQNNPTPVTPDSGNSGQQGVSTGSSGGGGGGCATFSFAAMILAAFIRRRHS